MEPAADRSDAPADATLEITLPTSLELCSTRYA